MTRPADVTGANRALSDLVAATPASRDRYVDFVRAASILVVVLGHWLIVTVTLDDSTFRAGNLIAALRWMWAATWVLQVMPIFFFMGGFSSFVALDALARHDGGYAEFVDRRLRRLLRPVAVLLGVWLPLVTMLQALELFDSRNLALAGVAVTQLLWFIGVYLIVVALAPPMLRLHRRFGLWIPMALAASCAVVDVLRFGFGVPLVGFLNFGLVWLFAHQLGFFYADGSLLRLPRSALLATAAGGLASLWALTRFGPYPLSMVGLPGEAVSNMNPPSVCLIALTMWQVALVLRARGAVSPWLARSRVWAAVIAVNSVIMTVLLWHLSALLIVAGVLLPLGFPQPVVGTLGWWLLRPVWIGILAGLTFAFVAVFGRFERPRGTPTPTTIRGVTLLSSLGIVLVIVGICGFAVSGLVDFVDPRGRTLIVLPVSPLINLLTLLAGVGAVRIANTGSSTPPIGGGHLQTSTGTPGGRE